MAATAGKSAACPATCRCRRWPRRSTSRGASSTTLASSCTCGRTAPATPRRVSWWCVYLGGTPCRPAGSFAPFLPATHPLAPAAVPCDADPLSVDSVSLLKLVCKGPRPEPLHAQITAALQRQAWAAAPPGLMQQLHPLQASDDSAAEPPGRVAAGGQRQPGSSGGRRGRGACHGLHCGGAGRHRLPAPACSQCCDRYPERW